MHTSRNKLILLFDRLMAVTRRKELVSSCRKVFVVGYEYGHLYISFVSGFLIIGLSCFPVAAIWMNSDTIFYLLQQGENVSKYINDVLEVCRSPLSVLCTGLVGWPVYTAKYRLFNCRFVYLLEFSGYFYMEL